MGILSNFSSIYCFITFIIGAVFMLATLCIVAISKDKDPSNNVHFYVARDKDGGLYLYLGKPVRITEQFIPCNSGSTLEGAKGFLNYGLNENDYANLKWEDEPVEVFINTED